MKLPYPLRSMCVDVTFHPFCWGFGFHRRKLTEAAKANADHHWWFRLLCFTVAYRRML